MESYFELLPLELFNVIISILGRQELINLWASRISREYLHLYSTNTGREKDFIVWFLKRSQVLKNKEIIDRMWYKLITQHFQEDFKVRFKPVDDPELLLILYKHNLLNVNDIAEYLSGESGRKFKISRSSACVTVKIFMNYKYVITEEVFTSLMLDIFQSRVEVTITYYDYSNFSIGGPDYKRMNISQWFKK